MSPELRSNEEPEGYKRLLKGPLQFHVDSPVADSPLCASEELAELADQEFPLEEAVAGESDSTTIVSDKVRVIVPRSNGTTDVYLVRRLPKE